MKDFRIYVQPRNKEGLLKKKEYLLRELQEFKGTSRLPELEIFRNGRLELLHELEPHRILRFSCEYLQKTVAATEPARISASFQLWQRKQGPLVVTFDAAKKVSRVAVALLSLALYDDPFAITPVRFNVSDFKNLKKNILGMESGTLTQIFLQNVKSQNGKIRNFQMTGSGLELFLSPDELMKNASKIRCMGFAFTSPEEGHRLSFRIIEWGGGTIYTPADPLDHEISGLLELLERTLF